jgi:membrane fusion protein
LDLRQANQLAATDRQISAVKQELAESEARRTVLIRAPEAGVATAAFAEVGHSVDSGLPLVSIVPSNTQLEAELYAPSKSIGFIKSGDAVNIRYQAYPYQKFGIYKGQVLSISRSSIPPAELARTVQNSRHGQQYRAALSPTRWAVGTGRLSLWPATPPAKWHALGRRHHAGQATSL